MYEITYPPRRTAAARQADRHLIQVLEEMLVEDETISARSVAARTEGIAHASSITRDSWRQERLGQWQARQAEARSWAERLGKRSKRSVAATMEQKDERIRELEAQVELLTASHRAMIRAVGEIGGMQAWMRLFSQSQPLLERLRQFDSSPQVPTLVTVEEKDAERPKK